MSTRGSGYFDSQGRQRVAEVRKNDLMKAYQQKLCENRQKQEFLSTQKPSRETSSVKYHQHVKCQSNPVLAGSDMTITAQKLTDESLFTGVCRQMLLDRDGNAKHDIGSQGTGELCASPKRARRLLKSTPVSQLNSLSRSGDYRAEVEWRLQLRPNIDS